MPGIRLPDAQVFLPDGDLSLAIFPDIIQQDLRKCAVNIPHDQVPFETIIFFSRRAGIVKKWI
jgi:hypothetical protein